MLSTWGAVIVPLDNTYKVANMKYYLLTVLFIYTCVYSEGKNVFDLTENNNENANTLIYRCVGNDSKNDFIKLFIDNKGLFVGFDQTKNFPLYSICKAPEMVSAVNLPNFIGFTEVYGLVTQTFTQEIDNYTSKVGVTFVEDHRLHYQTIYLNQYKEGSKYFLKTKWPDYGTSPDNGYSVNTSIALYTHDYKNDLDKVKEETKKMDLHYSGYIIEVHEGYDVKDKKGNNKLYFALINPETGEFAYFRQKHAIKFDSGHIPTVRFMKNTDGGNLLIINIGGNYFLVGTKAYIKTFKGGGEKGLSKMDSKSISTRYGIQTSTLLRNIDSGNKAHYYMGPVGDELSYTSDGNNKIREVVIDGKGNITKISDVLKDKIAIEDNKQFSSILLLNQSIDQKDKYISLQYTFDGKIKYQNIQF